MSAPLPSVTVVVVSYNAKAWLDQTLKAALRSLEGLSGELWVVDNASPDGSAEWVQTHFPTVRCIVNDHNPGFGTANNQVLHHLTTDTALVLNPDTLLTPENLRTALKWMQSDPTIGSLGCRMIDGSGSFLPESKRGLPTPVVALAKLTGLHRLFPRHSVLGRYYWNFLRPNENGPVEIHCGAYMLVRKEAVEATGGFDESFFMYGEDIDWSYRMLQAGYTNVYLGSEPMVHFKGESTKKGSLNYVRVFYEAMVVFAKKHFAPQAAVGFEALIGTGVFARAVLSVAKRAAHRWRWPLLDAATTWLALAGWTRYWEQNHRYIQGGSYPDSYWYFFAPALVLVSIATRAAVDGYRRPSRITPLATGLFLGLGVALAGYALLPEDLRFSRALVVLGTASSALLALFFRTVASLLGWGGINWIQLQQRRIVHVRDLAAAHQSTEPFKIAYGPIPQAQWTVGMNELPDSVAALGITEIQFYPDELDLTQVVRFMAEHPNKSYRFAYPDRGWVLASDSKDLQGVQTDESAMGLLDPANRRRKRQFDGAVALILLPFWPLLWLHPNTRPAARGWLGVVWGRKSWVGSMDAVFRAYPQQAESSTSLPDSPEEVYQKHWDIQVDLAILLRALRGKRA
jgi:GT2 family glycosyltransferase